MRHDRFTFLCNKDERQLIARLAQHLRRSQSDAIRFVLAEAVNSLDSMLPADPASIGRSNPILAK